MVKGLCLVPTLISSKKTIKKPIKWAGWRRALTLLFDAVAGKHTSKNKDSAPRLSPNHSSGLLLKLSSSLSRSKTVLRCVCCGRATGQMQLAARALAALLLLAACCALAVRGERLFELCEAALVS